MKRYVQACRWIIAAVIALATGKPALAQSVGGIGAMLIIDSTGGYTLPFIQNIVPLSPAALFIGPNNFILNVDSVSCRNKSINDVVALIRGNVGSTVKITYSAKKSGEAPKTADLTRAAIPAPAAPPPPDPAAAFSTFCDNAISELKKTRHRIVRTYSSECGDFFFNFNADTGTYQVRVLSAYEPGYKRELELTATVFNDNDESAKVQLSGSGAADKNNVRIGELAGTMGFRKPGIGVISTKLPAGDAAKKCTSTYIIIFK